MAFRRHRWKIVEKPAVGANEGHGQTEEAVFEGLSRLQLNRRLEDFRLGEQVHPTARLAHVAGDVGTGRLPCPEAYRLRFVGGHEPEVRHLPDRPGGKAHAVGTIVLRPEPAGVTKVGPGRGTENRGLQRSVAPFFGRHLRIGLRADRHHHSVAGEEHGFASAEAAERREKIGPRGAVTLKGQGFHTGSHYRCQRGLGGVEPALELDAGDVEHFRHLGEAVRLAIGGQLVADVELRKLEKITQLILELVAGEPTHRPAPVLEDVGPVHVSQPPAQRSDKGGAFFFGEIVLPLRRRHFALLDAVEEANPAVAILRVGRIEIESEEIEVPLHREVVVAIGAVVLDRGQNRGRQLGGEQRQRSEQRSEEEIEGKFHVVGRSGE